ARHDNSTSNLARHTHVCPSLRDSKEDGQLTIAQFARGSMYSAGRLRLYQVEMFALKNRPMAIVEDPPYRKILTMLHAGVETRSQHSASRDLKRVFIIAKKNVKKMIKTLTGRVHIALDGWTSPNVITDLGLIMTYVQDGQIKSLTLDVLWWVCFFFMHLHTHATFV
ncbi:hypothetical protein K435DRAFT_695041, partial [Dendrothele bispora CBS 962.96]